MSEKKTGRPSSYGARVQRSIRLDPDLARRLRVAAEALDVSENAAVCSAIEAWVAKADRRPRSRKSRPRR